MLMFWRRKKKKFNEAELINIKINKVESKFYNYEEVRLKDKHYINTVARNLQLEEGNDNQYFVTARYTDIPGLIVYFYIRLKDLQADYVSINNTVDIGIKADIKNGHCKNIKIEVFPVFERRLLIC